MAGMGARGFIYGTGLQTTSGILTNPGDQALIADTGPLTTGTWLFAVHGSVSVTIVYDVQRRDAGNASTTWTLRRRPAAGDVDWVAGNKLSLLNGERVRLILQGAVTGEVALQLLYQEAHE